MQETDLEFCIDSAEKVFKNFDFESFYNKIFELKYMILQIIKL